MPRANRKRDKTGKFCCTANNDMEGGEGDGAQKGKDGDRSLILVS